MKRNMHIRNIVNASLALLISASPGVNAMEDKGASLTTTQIRAEVERVLAQFKQNMDEYYARTRAKKGAVSTPQATQGDIQLPGVLRQTPAPLETQTRGLYNPFQDQYKFLSSVNGMLVLSETLANVRFKGRYGSQKPQFLCHYQITNPSEDHQPTSTVDCPQDYTSAIVQHFFPSPAGGILRMPARVTIDLIVRMDINVTGELLKIYLIT